MCESRQDIKIVQKCLGVLTNLIVTVNQSVEVICTLQGCHNRKCRMLKALDLCCGWINLVLWVFVMLVNYPGFFVG